MHPQVMDRLGLLLFFSVIIVCVFLAWYFQHKARVRERMALIEKGVDVEKLSLYNKPSKSALKIFIVLMGLAAVGGIYTIFLMIDEHYAYWIVENEAGEFIKQNSRPITDKVHGYSGQTVNDAAYPFVFFLCMSASFLIIHLIDRKERKNG